MSRAWALGILLAGLLDGPAARAEALGLVNASNASSVRGPRDCHGAPDGNAGTDHISGTGRAMNSWI